MDTAHINRILNLLRNPERTFLSVPFWIDPCSDVQIRNSKSQWKWFFQDIGKQSCIIGLLPFLEAAKHMRSTPLIESPYPQTQPEDDETFYAKLALISEWALSPSVKNKRKIIGILTPKNTRLRFDFFLGSSSPNQRSTAFADWLILIIIEERHFHNRVFSALACLIGMGYNHWFVMLTFQQNVLHHYESKLNLVNDNA